MSKLKAPKTIGNKKSEEYQKVFEIIVSSEVIFSRNIDSLDVYLENDTGWSLRINRNGTWEIQ